MLSGKNGRKKLNQNDSLRDVPSWFLRLVQVKLHKDVHHKYEIQVTRDISLVGLRNVAARNLFQDHLSALDVQLCDGAYVLNTDTELYSALLRTPIRGDLVLSVSRAPPDTGSFFASSLSNDVMALILTYCDVYDRLVWSRVCKRFQSLLTRPQVWRYINLKTDHRVMSHLWARKYKIAGVAKQTHPLEKYFGSSTLHCDLATEMLTCVPRKCAQLVSFSCTTVLGDAEMEAIGSFPPSLQRLQICCRDFGSAGCSLRNLKALRLTTVGSFKFSCLQEFERLEELCVSGSLSEIALIKELSVLPKICTTLTSLNTLGSSHGTWDKGTCAALSQFPSLTSLRVSMSTAAMYHIRRFHNLEALFLPSQTTDFDVGVVSSHYFNLRELNADGIDISPNGLAFLRSSMVSLTELSLQSANITMDPELHPLQALLLNDLTPESVSKFESLLQLGDGDHRRDKRNKSRYGGGGMGAKVMIDPPHTHTALCTREACAEGAFAAKLVSLNLGYSGIVGYDASLIGMCSNLTKLSLEQAPHLTDFDVENICNSCRYIKSFGLLYCKNVTGQSLVSLAKLSLLQELTFGPPESCHPIDTFFAAEGQLDLTTSLFDSLMQLELANCTTQLILAILEKCQLLNTILVHDYCAGFRDVCLLACVNLKLLKSLRVLDNAMVSTPALKYFEKVKAHGLSDVLILPSEIDISNNNKANSHCTEDEYIYDEDSREFVPPVATE